MQPRQYLHQLKSTGAESVSIDTSGSSRKATFRFDNVPTRLGDDWCYAQKVRVYVQCHVSQPSSGGSAISADDYYRMLSSIKLSSDDLGVLYGEGDLNGPQLGLVGSIISNGYRAPAQVPSDIAASTGANIVVPIDIPIGHACFFKGHQTGLWTGFFKNNGQLEINLSLNTWTVDAGSAASQVTGDSIVSAELLYTAEPEIRVPQIWHWRVRSTNANEKKHTIKDLCQGSGIKGATGIGKIAFLAYLSDRKGLGGADGIDNIQRVYPRDRGQPSYDLGSPLYAAASLLWHFIEQTNWKLGAPWQAFDYAYPLGLGAEEGSSYAPNVASAYFLPYFWPDANGQMVSKLQEYSGDYYIEQDYGSVPAAQAQWISLELAYLSKAQEDYLLGARMGVPPGQVSKQPKVDKPIRKARTHADMAAQQQKLRGIPKKVHAK